MQPGQDSRGLPSQAIAFCPLQEGKLDRSSPYIQVLEEDWRQALRDHQEQANTIFSLRKDLRQGEARRLRVGGQAGRRGSWGPSHAGWAELRPLRAWKVGPGDSYGLPPHPNWPDHMLLSPFPEYTPRARMGGLRPVGAELPPLAVHGGEGDVRAAVPGPA